MQAASDAPASKSAEAYLPSSGTDKVYCNGRFSFCLEYPGKLLQPEDVPANGDGISLSNENNSIRVHAYGYNRGQKSLNDELIASLELIRDGSPGVLIEAVDLKDQLFEIRYSTDENVVFHRVKSSEDNFFGISIFIDKKAGPVSGKTLRKIKKSVKVYKY